MHSMTGFGAAQSAAPFSIQVSIRSVNGRFLETRFHMGREFLQLESDLRKKLSQRLKRGTVDVFVVYPKEICTRKEVRVDRQVLKQIFSEARGAAKSMGLSFQDQDLRSFLTLPGVLSVSESVGAGNRETKALLKTFDVALSRLLQERRREGVALIRDLKQKLTKLAGLVKSLRTLSKKQAHQLEERLHQRISRKMDEQMDRARFGQELVFYLDRADISEELTRLEEHIQACQKLINSDTEVGKRLDFFCQELLREVNTVGSKSVSAGMTRLVVDAKTLIETLREQVQNIE